MVPKLIPVGTMYSNLSVYTANLGYMRSCTVIDSDEHQVVGLRLLS